MKTTCDFCKTEYVLNCVPATPVQCALCGNSWMVPTPRRQNSILMFIAAMCALLAAAIFAFVIIAGHHAKNAQNKPLVAQVSEISTVVDAFGVPHFVVTGRVVNRSDEIYGVPNLLIVSHDADGNIVARQKFMPSATLVESGGAVEFSHTLAASAAGVKKITVEFKEE